MGNIGYCCINISINEGKKKKEQMNGLPHKQKPDTDNLVKSVKDSLLKDDSVVWWEKAEKRWAYKGSIIIFE